MKEKDLEKRIGLPLEYANRLTVKGNKLLSIVTYTSKLKDICFRNHNEGDLMYANAYLYKKELSLKGKKLVWQYSIRNVCMELNDKSPHNYKSQFISNIKHEQHILVHKKLLELMFTPLIAKIKEDYKAYK